MPQHQEFLQSGTLSEPVLVEAAAQLLNNSVTPMNEAALAMISKALSCGLLAQGECGDMTARLLWIWACDTVISGQGPIISP